MNPTEDVSLRAPEAREIVLRAETFPALARHRIAHVGWMETGAPYRIVRVRPSGSFIHVCVAGEGRILLDGRWTTSKPGMACLAPPRVLNAFHAVPNRSWHFCWVRFIEPPGVAPVVHAASPVKTRCNPAILKSAIEGLQAEFTGSAEARFIAHWLELLVGEVQRLAKPWRENERLARVWERVGNDLAYPWTAEELARLAHCSPEHLRRLCLLELGRPPMQHVTSLRVQRAAELLLAGESKLAAVAEAVGYSDAFALSKIFKKWIGCAPANYREAPGKTVRSGQKADGLSSDGCRLGNAAGDARHERMGQVDGGPQDRDALGAAGGDAVPCVGRLSRSREMLPAFLAGDRNRWSHRWGVVRDAGFEPATSCV